MSTPQVHFLKREGGYWQFYYQDREAGRRVRKGAEKLAAELGQPAPRTDRDAQRLAAVWEASLAEGRYKPGSELSWDEFRDRLYDGHLTELSASYQRTMGNVLTRFHKHCRPKRLGDVTSASLRHYMAALKEEGKAPATVATYLGHLKAALSWAVEEELLPAVPKLPRKRRGKAAKVQKGKGRPISGEEFDRLMDKAEAVMGPVVAASWRHLLEGLWLSGLRLGEALELWWDRADKILVDFSGRYPMLRIPGSLQKSGKTELYPLTPDFVEFLQQTPEDCRRGRVFRPLRKNGAAILLRLKNVSARLSAIGKAAGVKVSGVDARKVKFASAHDLRRSFGNRWAPRVMPLDLQRLMRHENIKTTTDYYLNLEPEGLAARLWAGGHTGGHTGAETPVFPPRKRP